MKVFIVTEDGMQFEQTNHGSIVSYTYASLLLKLVNQKNPFFTFDKEIKEYLAKLTDYKEQAKLLVETYQVLVVFQNEKKYTESAEMYFPKYISNEQIGFFESQFLSSNTYIKAYFLHGNRFEPFILDWNDQVYQKYETYMALLNQYELQSEYKLERKKEDVR